MNKYIKYEKDYQKKKIFVQKRYFLQHAYGKNNLINIQKEKFKIILFEKELNNNFNKFNYNNNHFNNNNLNNNPQLKKQKS